MIDFFNGEISSWDYIKQCGLPVVIYGMGNGADKIIEKLNEDNVLVSEFFASDDFVRGQTFHGKRVKRLCDIEKEYTDFIIILGFGTERPDVISKIKDIAKRHEIIAPCVPVFGNNIFDRHFIESHEKEIMEIPKMLYDERSKETYKNIIKFNYSGKLDYLFECETPKNEVFDNVLRLSKNESYLDLGAYRGDTIDEFLKYTNNMYKNITALEPNPRTYKKLVDHCKTLNNFQAINAAVWSKNEKLFFDKKSGRMASVSQNGIQLDGITIDELAKERSFSYIKADVEGCEYNAIVGGRHTIGTQKPKLNIALYHCSEDIFQLPLAIKNICPEYKFYLRHHPYIPAWDTNLYCI